MSNLCDSLNVGATDAGCLEVSLCCRMGPRGDPCRHHDVSAYVSPAAIYDTVRPAIRLLHVAVITDASKAFHVTNLLNVKMLLCR